MAGSRGGRSSRGRGKAAGGHNGSAEQWAPGMGQFSPVTGQFHPGYGCYRPSHGYFMYPPSHQHLHGYQGYGHQQQPSPCTYYSIDVECVATGTDHNARSVAQIALVDEYERVLVNEYVLPDVPVVSYLTPITGITSEQLQARGVPLARALEILRAALPASAQLVGQNVRKDVEWLKLQEGVDFAGMVDLTGLYRIWNPTWRTYSVFSQDHLIKVLLGEDVGAHVAHDAAGDALKSMKLFKLHQQLSGNQEQWQSVEQRLLNAPPSPSFAKLHPSFEGVCMGNRKSCSCGAPFFS